MRDEHGDEELLALARAWREACGEWLEARREFARVHADPNADAARRLQSRCRLDFAIWRRARLLANADGLESLLETVPAPRASRR